MLRKIAAGTSAAVVAAALAVAPAAAAEPPRLSADPCAETATCVTVVPAVADFSAVKRRSSGPPPVGTPTPEVPSSPPPDLSGPGPGGAPPSAPPPPPASAAPPPAPEIIPPPAPPLIEPAPTPTTSPAEPRRPSEVVLPTAEVPTRLPQTAADSRPLTVVGGASLIAAGLAWIGGARRRSASS
jgi:LPXTG-motif cell wall-anchored protein